MWRGLMALSGHARSESLVESPGYVLYTKIRGTYLMQGEKAEQWRALCEKAAVEQDPDKLMGLVKEINRLLDEKEQRLRNQAANTQGTA
jgi:hypothetical protein